MSVVKVSMYVAAYWQKCLSNCMLVNFVTHKVAECSAIKKEWSHHKMFGTECHTWTTSIILQLSRQDKYNSVTYDINVAQCHTQCHLQQRSISLLQMSAWDEISTTMDDKLHSGHASTCNTSLECCLLRHQSSRALVC